MAFEIGALVQLKSGGPALTVVGLGEFVSVAWYSEAADEYKRDSFPELALDELEYEDDEDEDGEDDAEA